MQICQRSSLLSSEWAYCSKDRETMKRRWILAVFFSQFLQHSYINELIPTLPSGIETPNNLLSRQDENSRNGLWSPSGIETYTLCPWFVNFAMSEWPMEPVRD